MGRRRQPSNSRIMLFSDMGGTITWRQRQPYFEVENGGVAGSPRYDARYINTRGRLKSFQVRNSAGVLVTVKGNAPLTEKDIAWILRVDLKSLRLPSMSHWTLAKTVADLDALIESRLVNPKTGAAAAPSSSPI